MGQNNTDCEKTITFKGTDLKYLLKIESEGFSMDDDDFKIILRNSFGTKKVEIEKSQMLKSGGDGNHSDVGSTKISVSIAKATGSATVTGASVTYNRGAQNLLSVSGNTGTMHYRVGTGGSWTTVIPSAINAGSSTIYYYMDASTNYTARGSQSSPCGNVTGSITKATPVVRQSPVKVSDFTYDGSAHNLLSGGSMKHSSSDSTAVAGRLNVQFKA